MIDGDELAAWMRLLDTPGIGRASARRLLQRCGSPDAVLSAGPRVWREHLSPAMAAALQVPAADHPKRVATTLQWLQACPDDSRRQLIPVGDPAYPPTLLQSPDPPLLLYVEGDAARLTSPALAIVGSRQPTPAGIQTAATWACGLSAAGLCIVSGLARGIDAAAHSGGLDGRGRTVAVVGTGLDRVYPRQHRALADRIVRRGAVVSEYPLGSPPLARHFPQRNRIIAGLTQATLVIEATLQSGSLITARLALEAGRDVMAVPGPLQSPQSRGCHALIKQGAALVESVDDVLAELGLRTLAPAPPAARLPSGPVLDALGFSPLSFDALAERTGWNAAALHAELLSLELAGRVARLPGACYQRLDRA